MSARHPDEAALDRIATSLDETLFVEAGAGSGKTRTLVNRLVNLVVTAGVPVQAIAAITFTEKAAAELRERVRHALEDEARPADAVSGRRHGSRQRAREALDDLDGAAIGTLHSFAHRILIEHAVDAGLPPRIDVLDEVASMVAFDERWAAFLDEVLEDPGLARPILLLTAVGVRLDQLRQIALEFNQNWDVVADRGPDEASPLPDWDVELDRLLDRIDGACAQRDHCQTADDRLHGLLDELAHWAEQVRAAPDESARLALLHADGGRPKGSPNRGAKTNWPRGYDLDGLRNELQAIRDDCDDLANRVAEAALSHLAVALRRVTLGAAEQRRREGTLEFHDLLVMARQLLRDPVRGPAVRAALADRYRRLLIDEFQDTDPIQVELAVLVASVDPFSDGDRDWHEIPTVPGRLFFVGDPKQSIYRFRRADIATFLQTAEIFGAAGQRVTLAANHRSGQQLVEWVNEVFGRLMPAPEPADPSDPNDDTNDVDANDVDVNDLDATHVDAWQIPSAPAYEPSVARRPDAPGGPPVALLGREAHEDSPKADEVRERESLDVAAAIRQVLGQGWLVDRSRTPSESDWRPAGAGDITVLVPTRLSLPFLEDALTDAGIPYRTESSSLVYGSRLVRDLFVTLRAIDDPSDELSIVAALRSALFGCGDDDLFTFRRWHNGSFDYTRTRAGSVPEDHPVGCALEYLRKLHERRRWAAPSELLDQVVRDRRLLELGTAGPIPGASAGGRARDLWHRIRFITDQARAWTDATGGGSLRQYLDWVRHQSTPGARITEAVLPETDDDAVRIMTIHAAKGLQFPITIVAGLSTQPQVRRAGAQVVWPPAGPPILNIGRRVTSQAYEAWRPIDEQMSHDERVRLLYVACTRAKDHLIVSLHRRQRANPPDQPSRLTSAEVLVEAMGEGLDRVPDVKVTDAIGTAPPAEDVVDPNGAGPAPGAGTAPLPTLDAWRYERSTALATSGRPRTIAATALSDEGLPDGAPDPTDPGLQKRPRDLDLPPWRKGRYGTAIGRATHGVLQAIDLATGAGLDEAVAAQAVAEGVPGYQDRIRKLVRGALATPTVAEAASRPHWREVHVAVPVPGDRLLEGYVDLLYRGVTGLVVVDYKTGPDEIIDDLATHIERYRLQGAAYALAVGEATGEAVVAMTFVFLTPHAAVEHTLHDLPALVASARHALAP
jgi:ATP-dependent helicase/nuclease subunit A